MGDMNVIRSQAVAAEHEVLSDERVAATLHEGLAGTFRGQRLLVLIPDHTRSVPMPFLFRCLVEILGDAQQLDFMVALGTHPPLERRQLEALVGLMPDQATTLCRHVRLLNHEWNNPLVMQSIGCMEQSELREIAGAQWHASLPDRVDICINRAALECDHILIVGPTFPHEVVGYSGGNKYLFPGISGPEMIDAMHWLGALGGVIGTIGCKDTPARRMIEAAARRLPTPVTAIALVVDRQQLAGMFIGDATAAWSEAADLSARRHVQWCKRPYRRVLSCAPPMYDELWTAAKAMYKLEPAVEVGGEVIIYAPHLKVVSRTHGRYIYQIGYHTLPYFLADWDRFSRIPRGVLAHSTHLRGSGHMEGTVERPNVRVTLASQIPAEDCERLNLGYLDPSTIRADEWKGREDEGILFVARAGETLYKIRPQGNQVDS